MARLSEDELKRILGRNYVPGLNDVPSRWETLMAQLRERFAGRGDDRRPGDRD
jgi:hypothetical protein